MRASETAVALAAANAAFLGLVLAIRREPGAGDRRLGQFLLALAGFLASFSLNFLPAAAAIPAWDIGYVVLVHALGPAFYLFVAERSGGRAARWSLAHAALPTLALALCALAFPWLLSRPPLGTPPPGPVLPIQAFAAIGPYRAQIPLYLLLSLRALRAARRGGLPPARERLLAASLALFAAAWAADALASLAVILGELPPQSPAWLGARATVLVGMSLPSFALGYLELALPSGATRGPARGPRGCPAAGPEGASAVYAALSAYADRERPWLDPGCEVEDLARALGLSPREVSKAINGAEGRGTRAFLNARRVGEARRLLLERPEDSILDVALDCGFNAKSTFNRAFKELAGETPSEYRARLAGGGPASGSGTTGPRLGR